MRVEGLCIQGGTVRPIRANTPQAGGRAQRLNSNAPTPQPKSLIVRILLRQADAQNADAYKAGSQFLDVGFLAFVVDPAGFKLEMLQTTFEANAEERKRLVQLASVCAAVDS